MDASPGPPTQMHRKWQLPRRQNRREGVCTQPLSVSLFPHLHLLPGMFSEELCLGITVFYCCERDSDNHLE